MVFQLRLFSCSRRSNNGLRKRCPAPNQFRSRATVVLSRGRSLLFSSPTRTAATAVSGCQCFKLGVLPSHGTSTTYLSAVSSPSGVCNDHALHRTATRRRQFAIDSVLLVCVSALLSNGDWNIRVPLIQRESPHLWLERRTDVSVFLKLWKRWSSLYPALWWRAIERLQS